MSIFPSRRTKLTEICRVMGLILALILLSGCSMYVVQDRLPRDAPRGHVKFYPAHTSKFVTSNMILPIRIFRLEGGERISHGRISMPLLSTDEMKIRIALEPGIHDFIIEAPKILIGGPPVYSEHVTVEIIEGMVTPVKIVFHIVAQRTLVTGKETIFSVELIVEEPIPLEK